MNEINILVRSEQCKTATHHSCLYLKVIKGGSLKLLDNKFKSCLKFKKEHQNLTEIEENMKDEVLLIEPSLLAGTQ